MGVALEAANQENASAQYYMGVMFQNGHAVPKNFAEAHKWYNLAAANGEKKAVTLRDRLAKQMTPAQIAKAQRLAREWKPKTP